MSKKNFIIKYGGTKFSVSPVDAITIERYKVLLFVKRQWRRLIQRAKYLKNTLILIPLWLVFLAGVYVWAQSYKPNYIIVDLIWDVKYTLFTSVVITSFIAYYNGRQRHNGVFSRQFSIYIDMLYAAEELGLAVLNCSSGEKKINYNKYHDFMFFTCERLDAVLFQLQNRSFDLPESLLQLKKAIRKFQKQLLDIRSHILDQPIMWYSDKYISEKFIDLINDAIGICKQCDSQNISVIEVIEYEKKILQLIEIIRTPWRKDYKINQAIRQILLKNDPDAVKDDFYMCLFLNILKYDGEEGRE